MSQELSSTPPPTNPPVGERIPEHLEHEQTSLEPGHGMSTDRPTDRPARTMPEPNADLADQNAGGAECQPERFTAPAASVHPECRRPDRPNVAALERVLSVRALRARTAGQPSTPSGRGPGSRGLADLADLLSPRDVAVLDLIAEHRFLTTAHIQTFCFTDHASAASGARSCRRVLQRLAEWRLLERPFRRIGGLEGGSASAVWMLTSTGARLRSLRLGLGAVGQVRAPGERFVAHYLAIADARLHLVQAERAGQLQLLTVQIEPRCWRSYTGLHGGRVVLKPDLALVTTETVPDAEVEHHWFVEIDRGTESLPTLLKQCRAYEAYRRSGEAEAQFGVFPLVAWVVPDERRAERLSAAIAAAHDLPTELFRVTTPERFLDLIRGVAS